ncbi:predicted protein [Nematostella vectensis]|uniref:JmjC domain-containing protein n=1 Tax=Nematostella vectensis TaxID=45351 RepID=A7RPA5_NEMVE|nr:predicted protein [Nematostella vectensis]|eukprot:XP_001638713.1 predicted protein [Nematostella vectensis]
MAFFCAPKPKSAMSLLVGITLLFPLIKSENAVNLEGHLKPIFSFGRRNSVEVFQGFPSPQEFFTNFVIPAKPVLFSGGAKRYPAFERWNDNYFKSFRESNEFKIAIEHEKKENRSLPGEDIPFSSFVDRYTQDNIYMVNSVPDFLRIFNKEAGPLSIHRLLNNYKMASRRKDIYLPSCIACPDITKENLVENVNVTEMGFSGVDIDKVDLDKFPGLYNLEHWHVVVKEGDCLYLPFLWVHQVTSYDSNVAVNVWWKTNLTIDYSSCYKDGNISLGDVEFVGFGKLYEAQYRMIKVHQVTSYGSNVAVNVWWKTNLTIDYSSCYKDGNISLGDVEFVGFGKLYEAQYRMIKNRITHAIRRVGPLTLEKLEETFKAQTDIIMPGVEMSEDVKTVIRKMFILLDQYTADQEITTDDVNRLDNKDWELIRLLLNDMIKLVNEDSEKQAARDAESETENEEENYQDIAFDEHHADRDEL